MKDSSNNASKSFYRISRECCNLTLENASELMVCISPSRLHKIESGKSYPHPDEVLRIAQCYNDPELVLHYCTEFCEIGKAHFPQVRLNSSLSDIFLKLLRNIEVLRTQAPVMLQFEIENLENNLEIMDRKEFQNFRKTLLTLSCATLELNMWIEKNHT